MVIGCSAVGAPFRGRTLPDPCLFPRFPPVLACSHPHTHSLVDAHQTWTSSVSNMKLNLANAGKKTDGSQVCPIFVPARALVLFLFSCPRIIEHLYPTPFTFPRFPGLSNPRFASILACWFVFFFPPRTREAHHRAVYGQSAPISRATTAVDARGEIPFGPFSPPPLVLVCSRHFSHSTSGSSAWRAVL
ncbi:hypothetical protein EXIGLDRAFT_149185 [Exidia glandulosa HHB12029]|uniref:Uncharacterized protein n=1 Tax=Exidia glandulosa HHB12029 TaxID=1314781 RepID=A0A165FNC2_EXIGL|nr:hypothetical protein EXIGLDRAFT_149185 [Exidia glandulosa HHB12029]